MFVIPIWFEIIGILLLRVREGPNWDGTESPRILVMNAL